MNWRLKDKREDELGVIEIQTNHLGLIRVINMCAEKFYKDVKKIEKKILKGEIEP